MQRVLCALLLLVGLVPATLHAAPVPTYASIDARTDLARSYVGARYYASRTGRFTTVDPGHVNGNIFDPQSWNGYAYARNNPLRFIDPTGTDYTVSVDGGYDFWFQGNYNQFAQFASGFTLSGGGGGSIYNAAGAPVGSYQYCEPLACLVGDIGRRSAPAEYLAGGAVAFMGGAMIASGAAAYGSSVVAVNLQGAATTAALTLPAGAKLGQMIARGGYKFAGNPEGFLSFARDFVGKAIAQGTYRVSTYIEKAGTTIYRVGNDYLTVARDGRILSYVPNARAGEGVVLAYGGR